MDSGRNPCRSTSPLRLTLRRDGVDVHDDAFAQFTPLQYVQGDWAGIDTFRPDGDGKVAEHWDVLQIVPATVEGQIIMGPLPVRVTQWVAVRGFEVSRCGAGLSTGKSAGCPEASYLPTRPTPVIPVPARDFC